MTPAPSGAPPPGPPGDFPHRIGRVARAHGLDGSLRVQLFRPRTPTAAMFKSRSPKRHPWISLELEDGSEVPHRLERVRFLDGVHAVVHLEGVGDRTAAEALENAYLDVAPGHLPELLTDEVDRYFDARVLDVASDPPREIGRVEGIRDFGAHPILMVGDPPVMIPAVDAFIEGVDDSEGERVVRVRALPGLLDANPGPSEAEHGADADADPDPDAE